MIGETVTIHRWRQTGVDAGNNPVWEPVDEPVENVLVQSPSGSNAGDTTRPDGITVDLTLQFPRVYTGGRLRGCDITVRGLKYRVVGDPIPLDGGMTPTQWNMTVNVTRSEG